MKLQMSASQWASFYCIPYLEFLPSNSFVLVIFCLKFAKLQKQTKNQLDRLSHEDAK
jgi:hypothetical protein